MNTLKKHLVFTINYLADKLKKGKTVPKALLPLLKPPAVYGEEDEDLDDDDGEEGEGGSRKRSRAPPARYVAEPAKGAKMQFEDRRDRRNSAYETALLAPLSDPRIFLEAAVNSDPEEKVDGIEKNLTAAASKAVMEAETAMKGLLSDIESADEKLDVAMGATEMAQASHAAAAARLRSVMVENAKLKGELARLERSETARKREEGKKAGHADGEPPQVK